MSVNYGHINSILVLGDSVSKGVVFSAEKKRYIFSKKRFINSIAEKIRPKVFDLSKYGSTTKYGKQLLKAQMASLNPDMVLIEYGCNDCDFNWKEVINEPDAIHSPKLSLEEYTDNIKSMIADTRAHGKTPVLTNLHPLNGADYFRWFTKGDAAAQIRALKWLKKVSNIYWWQEMYSCVLEQTAKKLGVFVVNIRGAFLRLHDWQNYLCEDGIHPNEQGHALMTKIFMDVINNRAAGLL